MRNDQIALAKQFIDLAHDTGALAVKVRPNGIPQNATVEATVRNIGESLHEIGEAGAAKKIEIWLEVHGRTTQNPPVAAAIMLWVHAAVHLTRAGGKTRINDE